MKNFILEKWNINVFGREATKLPINEPPCKNCKFFTPQQEHVRLTDGRGLVPAGIRVCQAEDMYHDFSCYEERRQK